MSSLKYILARLVITASNKPDVKVWTRRYGRLDISYRNGEFKYKLLPENVIRNSPWSVLEGPEVTKEEAIKYYDEWYKKKTTLPD
jgi:hypothetical protein